MAKRSTTSYRDYVKKYRAMEERLAKKGLKPESLMMDKKLYQAAKADIKANGISTNINRTIVQAQSYQYGYKVARGWRETAKKYNLEWQDISITQLRSGQIDLSGINEILKKEGMSSGIDRAGYIAHNVFGSK